ncbi:MAG: HAMP domain-containing sensor histidine kinase [Balneolaceae bacterium]
MRIRSYFYIQLLLFSFLCSGEVISADIHIPGGKTEVHHPEKENTYAGNGKVKTVSYAGVIPGKVGSVTVMQASGTAPFWWSAWYYVLLTVVIGSILIYLYNEHGKKVISVREENDSLKVENERLNEELAKRMKEIESIIEQLKKAEEELVEKSQKAGMAEMAAGVLHNVANVLSSVNSSNSFILDTAKHSKIDGLLKANQMLREHIDHIDQFIFEDPKGKKLLKYYLKLEEPLRKERADILSQSERLDEKINIINDVITAQQSHVITGNNASETSLSEIVEVTLSLQEEFIDQHQVNVIKELNASTPVIAQRSKLVHVLVNFIKNAAESMEKNHPENKNLRIKSWEDSYKVYLSVTDNGAGIKNENLDKIFDHTFTTKKKGHGFGLHSSANYMKEMGGKIEVRSDGNAKGTTFTLVFPKVKMESYSDSFNS